MLWFDSQDKISRMKKASVHPRTRLEKQYERLRQQLPGLALAGNGYRGIGVPDCIRSGREAAAHVLANSK